MLARWIAMAVLAVGVFAAGPDPWKPNELVQPADVAARLSAWERIYMVGPRVLYNGGHIKGAEFAGQTNSDAGIAHLLHAVESAPKDKPVLIYCGCCPMGVCPNIRPAYKALKDAGFADVKVLNIPTNLKTDWTDKGYPVEKGEVEK